MPIKEDKLSRSSLTPDQREAVRSIIVLYDAGMSYLDIGKRIRRAKRSVVRTVKSFGVKHHRDCADCLEKRRSSGVPYDNGSRRITPEIQAARMEEKKIRKAHLEEHRDVVRHWAWYENRLKQRHYSTAQCLKLLKNNPGYMAKFYARKRIKNMLKNKGVWASGGSVSKWIGCSGQDLKHHLESKFKDGMTWDNHGSMWEIDHIIPLASASLTNTSEVVRLSHWSNLQPLLKHENKAKSDRVNGVSRSRIRFKRSHMPSAIYLQATSKQTRLRGSYAAI
jgi:5-methylcytosine-specific restriction endonuclease McrA